MHLLALLALLAAGPVPAAGDIYKWTDAQGRTVVSDVPPMDPARVSGMKLLASGSRAAQPAQAADAPRETQMEAEAAADARAAEAARRQEELETRIAELERQLQAQQAEPQPPPAPIDEPGAYYPAPPAPEAVQYGGPVAVYSQTYYSTVYVPPPAFAVVVARPWPVPRASLPTRRPASVAQPARAIPASLPQHRPLIVGRTPNFVGPTPQFVGRTPQFVGPAPQFVPTSPQPQQHRPQFMNGQPRFAYPVPQVHAPPPANAPQRPRR